MAEAPENYTLILPDGKKLLASRGYTGKAKALYTNGDTYEGEFVEGIRNGKGKYTYANGDVSICNYLDNHKHGLGTTKYHDGSTYYGYFSHGKRSNE